MVKLELTRAQAQAMGDLISMGVSALGAQIAQGGAETAKKGAEVLATASEIIDALKATMLLDAAEAKAAEKPNGASDAAHDQH